MSREEQFIHDAIVGFRLDRPRLAPIAEAARLRECHVSAFGSSAPRFERHSDAPGPQYVLTEQTVVRTHDSRRTAVHAVVRVQVRDASPYISWPTGPRPPGRRRHHFSGTNSHPAL